MLVVNCSYEPNDLLNYLKNDFINCSTTTILDFASSFNKENAYKVIYPADVDPQNEKNKLALDEYLDQIGKFSKSEINGGSGTTIRSLTFNSVPLYWLTGISEKHPRISLLKKLYFFKQVFSLLNYKGNEIAFVLPLDASHFVSVITEHVQNNIKQIKNVFFNVNEPLKSTFKEHLKNANDFFKKILFVRKQIKHISTTNSIRPDVLVFTNYPETWRDEINGDYILHEVINYSAEHDKKTFYAPCIFDYYNLKGINLRENWDPFFFSSFPSLLEIVKFYLQFVLIFFSIRKISLKNSQTDFLNTNVLFFEISNVLKDKREYLFNYIWFKKYFKKFEKPIKIFYQDEFYPSGRITSAAAKNSRNKNIKTYGVQHGVYYESQTVYAISNDEINPHNNEDGMPMPDKFIVWGNYFKRHFLKYNSMDPEYVISAGNPNYTKLQIKSNGVPLNKPARILWCTTSRIDIINHYKNIISEFLDKDNRTVITVRCHPHFDYVAFMKDELIQKAHSERILYSQSKSIYDDFKNSDIVLTSTGSTVFLDAMVYKKPVFKLVNDDYFMGDLGKKEMKDIYTPADLLKAVDELFLKPNETVDYSDLLKTDSSEWIKLFK